MAQATDNVVVASPAAATMARRATREATPAKRKVAACYDKDDDEWTLSSEEDDSSDEDGEAGEEEAGEVRGRVRLHAVKKRASGGLEADDERRKSLSEKGWARRSVVMHGLGPSGADELEAVPGREAYGAGDEGAARWAEDMLEYNENNFNDAGIEVRSLDQRERKVGLFGDFLERVGHGKFLERSVKKGL